MPQGIDTPGVEEFPRRGETPGVATEGGGVTGEDGWGRGGNRHPPTTQATKERGAGGGRDAMTHGPRTAAPPRPQRGTAVDNDSAGPQPRQSDGANGARPKNGTHLRRK